MKMKQVIEQAVLENTQAQLEKLIVEIYDLYDRYPASLISQAIGQYRKETELVKEEAEIDKKIEELTEKKALINKKKALL